MPPKTYGGQCHCGLIRYTVTLPEALAPEGEGKINSCNCSVCTKSGYRLVYPKREDVKFLDGCDAKLKEYSFGDKAKPHRFCPECGSSVLIDFQNSRQESQRPYLAMNACLFDGIDLDKAQWTTFDGMNKLQPPYEVAPKGL